MVKTKKKTWPSMKNAESELVENVLGKYFQKVDAYRLNSASIRVRIVDEQFKGKSDRRRNQLAEKRLKELPKEISDDIMVLITITPEEVEDTPDTIHGCLNYDFENPPTDL